MLGHEEAKQLAIYLGCDTRKVLNTLQYWLAALPREEEVSRAAKDGRLLGQTITPLTFALNVPTDGFWMRVGGGSTLENRFSVSCQTNIQDMFPNV